jgi:hypothetical protein
LLTNKKSPTNNDFSIEAVGMVKGSNRSHLIREAATTAKIKASAHSLAADFLGLDWLISSNLTRKIENHP